MSPKKLKLWRILVLVIGTWILYENFFVHREPLIKAELLLTWYLVLAITAFAPNIVKRRTAGVIIPLTMTSVALYVTDWASFGLRDAVQWLYSISTSVAIIFYRYTYWFKDV